MVVTEALAEIKTIAKRIEKKQEFVLQFLVRADMVKDPLLKDGIGSYDAVARERQAIRDLEQRLVTLRLAIQKANTETPVTVEGVTKSLSEWLVWRREVAPGQQQRLQGIRLNVQQNRANLTKALAQRAGAEAPKPDDIVVNVDEQQLAKDAEQLETILGALDGMLSLKNATVLLSV